ncbi:hypothetical protein [Streptosporangium vulgare]|uniref:hypothetical protein n=1 Tax=Streptosporangium vulgare TaxID=46190 RepID=UPI0031DEC94A
MNRDDMRERGLAEADLVDITSIARDGSRRTVHGYRAFGYDIRAAARPDTCPS